MTTSITTDLAAIRRRLIFNMPLTPEQRDFLVNLLRDIDENYPRA